MTNRPASLWKRAFRVLGAATERLQSGYRTKPTERPQTQTPTRINTPVELILLALITALGKTIVLARLITLRRLVIHQIWFEVFFTFILPLAFLGTFSGAILGVFSGIWFTIIVRFLGLFVKTT